MGDFGQRATKCAQAVVVDGNDSGARMPLLRREVLVGGDKGDESVHAGLRQQLVVA